MSTTVQTPARPLSHRKYEAMIYRRANNGRKRYPLVIHARMALAAEQRAASKAARAAEAAQVLSFPVSTQDTPAPEEKLLVRYEHTAVVWKKIRDVIVALVFFDDDSAKHAEVYHVDPEALTAEKRPKSRAQSYSHEELREKGWKAGTLGDDMFAPILARFEESDQVAA